MGLTSSQRTKLRRLIARGKLKVEHKWGDPWELTPEIREALGIRSAVDVAMDEEKTDEPT